jgi:uncharacterized protein (TIRG00374 family)
MRNRWLGILLKYGLAFGLLAFVFWSSWGRPGDNGLGDVWRRYVIEGQSIRGEFLLVAFGIYTAATFASLVRWHVLVRAQGLPLSFSSAMSLGLVGCFFNAFLPGSMGGDIVRAAVLAGGQKRRTTAVTTVVMDRVMALWGLFFFVAVVGGVSWSAGGLENQAGQRSRFIVLVAGLGMTVSVAVWLLMGLLNEARAEKVAQRLLSIPRLGSTAAEFWRALWRYRCRTASVILALALSWVGSIGFVAAFHFAAHTLQCAPGAAEALPTMAEHFLIVPVGLLVQAVVPLPGGMGIGEWGFGALYRLLGYAAVGGVLASLVLRVVGWGIGLVGGVVYLSLRSGLGALVAEGASGGSPIAVTSNEPTEAAADGSLPR